MEDKVTALEEVVVFLGDKDAEFAQSMCDQFKKKGNLSEKQLYWVEKLTHRALNQGDDAPDNSVQVGDFANMVSMFETAGSNIKYPKLVFVLRQGDDEFKVVVKRAGPKSKYHGQLMLTDGGPFGDNVWYGRITQEGAWVPSAAGEKRKDKMVPFLESFANNPHNTVSSYGHKAGHCCFCNKGLTDEKSVTVGYGPVCAQNWGLKSEWKQALVAASSELAPKGD